MSAFLAATTRAGQAHVALALLALCCFPRFATAAASNRLSIHVWSDSLLPAVFQPDDTHARRSFAPDSIAPASRPTAAMPFVTPPPVVDGDLEDWRLVRWNQVAGARAVTRGTWSGPDDAGLRYALGWTTAGIVFAADVRDDLPGQAPPAVALSFASDAPFVQRSWMGPSRRLRVRADGVVETWTDLRGKRIETFDAAELGVRACVRRDSNAARDAFTVEVVVPWDFLHPALPHADARLALNIGLEDTDGATFKQLDAFVRGQPLQPAWARCQWEGGPAAGTWMVSCDSPTIESTAEWSVLRWGTRASAPVPIRMQVDGASGKANLEAVLPRAAAIVRIACPPVSSVLPNARAVRITLQSPAGKKQVERDARIAPTMAALIGLRDAVASTAAHAPSPTRFPSPADLLVRLDRAGRALTGIGTAFERRFHPSGIVAHRAGGWPSVERWLEDAQALADASAEPAGDVASRRDPRSGIPLDRVVLRGLRSGLDGSIQPYALYVPSAVLENEVPLVLALHGLRGDESELFRATRLAAAAAARGWIVVCPFGRGDNGYEFAGERDVLEVLEAVRAVLPVDGRRLYVTGHGMGGTGTWLLSLRHPQLFAAAAPVSAYGDLEQPGLSQALGYRAEEAAVFAAHNPARLAHRGLETAIRIVHGERDAAVSVVHARIMAAKLAELGVPHELRIDANAGHGIAFFDAELDSTLDFMSRHTRATTGRVDADRFAGSGGPVAEFFVRGPFAIVYGTRGESPVDSASGEPRRGPVADLRVAQQLVVEWSARFAGEAAVLPDSALTLAMLRNSNLILVGDAGSNRWLERWRDALPVRDRGDGFILGAETLLWSQAGVLYAAKNPEHPERSLLVAAGIAGRVLAPRRSLLMLGADYVVLESAAMRAGHFPKAAGR